MIKFLKYLIRKNWEKYKLLQELKMRFPTCNIADNVIIKGPLKNLELGNNVIVQSNVFLHLGGMEWCNHAGHLKIGDNSVISPNCVLYATGQGGISIGKSFDCGPGVSIFSSRSDYKNKGKHLFKPVVIGDNVTIFSNAILGPGVNIGDGACIASGAVVTKNIEANHLAGGIPAKSIKVI